MLPITDKPFLWQGRLPRFQRAKLEFPRPRVADIQAAVEEAIAALDFPPANLSGKRVAITGGSRGVTQIPEILAAVAQWVRRQGGEPFIFPAMGSHGGATAEGQRQMLEHLGVTEAAVGAPIISSMDTELLGRLDNGMPVYIDRHAAQSDAIIVVNRIKPHTDYTGDFESGIAKMTAIGMGKLQGADIIHRYGVEGLLELMPQAARLICRQAPVLFGLASIENAYHEVAQISAIPADQIAGEQEKALLQTAYSLMPRFPFPEIDVLIVDEMGKNISGVGMDPNVIGRARVHGVEMPAGCSIRAIAVLRLTPETHGNASGIGLADVTTERILRDMDFDATYLNCITSGITGIQRAMLPLVAPTEKAAIETAFRVCGQPESHRARAVRIKNTLSLGEMDISLDLLPEIRSDSRVTPIGQPFELCLNVNGDLL